MKWTDWRRTVRECCSCCTDLKPSEEEKRGPYFLRLCDWCFGNVWFYDTKAMARERERRAYAERKASPPRGKKGP